MQTCWGRKSAKRGMALAAAGELGLLMIGSPGSGKTMLARRMTGILPELSVEDQQGGAVHPFGFGREH